MDDNKDFITFDEKENIEIVAETSESSEIKPKKKSKKPYWIATIVVILIVISAVIILQHNKTEYKNTGTDTVHTTSISEITIPIERGTDKFVEAEIKSTPISLSEYGLNAFEEYLKKVQPTYEYSDMYNIEASFERYKEKKITKVDKHTHDVRVNGKPDSKYLYELVLKNNKDYLENSLVVGYTEPRKKEIKDLCEWICEVIPQYIEKYPEIEANSVYCNLYDLKILINKTSFDNASVCESNIFNYNRERMESNKSFMNTDDIYTSTFYHEMAHLCQISCNCYSTNDEWRIGMSNVYNDMDINSFGWTWLVESAAEIVACDMLDIDYTTYTYMIGYENSLAYLSLLNENSDPEVIEKLCFQNDVEKLFDLFDIVTEDEKIEFAKMMYSIEILQTKPYDFLEVYKEKTGEDLLLNKYEEPFNLSVKDDVYLTMTKLFYRNLARLVNKNDVTLEDVYYLTRVWEGKLGFHFSNKTYGYMVAFKDFYESYSEIQQEFFKLLSEENSLSLEEIDDGFANYSMNIQNGKKVKSPNCDLKFFSAEKKNFVNNMVERYYSTGSPRIKDCIKIAEKCELEMEEATTVSETDEKTTHSGS